MDRLKRLREPLVVVALVALVIYASLLLTVAGPAPDMPLGVTLAELAYSLVEPVLLALLTGLLVVCWVAEPSPHARGLTMTGLVLTAALLAGAVGLSVAATLLGVYDWWSPTFVALAVPPISVAVISLAVQVALVRRPLPVPAPMPELAPAEPEPEPEPVDPQQQPGWTPDAAVGTVWRRAGDAASQTPSTSWDGPGQTEGWGGPDSRPDLPPESTRRAEE